MKHKFLVAAGITIVAAAVSAFVYVNNEKGSMDDLFYANVEALARGENNDGTRCFNSITTSEGQKVLYCGDCCFHPGKPTIFSGSGTCD